MTRAPAMVLVLLLPQVAAADPCVPPGSDPVMLAMAGGKVSYCFAIDNAKASCFTTEVATANTAASPSPAPPGQAWPTLAPSPRKLRFKHADGGKRPQLCHGDGSHCVTLAMTHEIDQGMGLIAAENAALTVAALATLEWIDTFDVKTGKRLASFSTGPKHSSCNWLDFAGDTLVVRERADCAQTSSTAWLATRTGVKIAEVGGSSPITLGAIAIARATGDSYAFVTEAGDALIYQDVKTGKVNKRITIGPVAADTSVALLGDDSSLALVFGGARAGDVAIIDLATDKISTSPGKRCTL
jgi:hypothetical protein